MDFFQHLFGICSDSHSHFKLSDLFFSLNEIRDKIIFLRTYLNNLPLRLKKIKMFIPQDHLSTPWPKLKIHNNNPSTNYDENFEVTPQYLAALPDLQFGEIKGASEKIAKVGISNFHLPLEIKQKNGGVQLLECSIVGTVSLEALKKGINMSRILRTFYDNKDNKFDIGVLSNILTEYKKNLDTFEAHILCTFRYKMWQESLRSKKEDGTKNGGWQFYNITFEVNQYENLEKIIHLDFVYSSACPCSTELSLHALKTRNQYGIPHSQRSVMRISVLFDEMVWIEDIIKDAREALKTETLVFCKREDEQAFAELNAANTKFVEDAVRLMYQQLKKRTEIIDFKLIASHNESLHSHDAIAVIVGGNGFFNDHISVADLKSLVY